MQLGLVNPKFHYISIVQALYKNIHIYIYEYYSMHNLISFNVYFAYFSSRKSYNILKILACLYIDNEIVSNLVLFNWRYFESFTVIEIYTEILISNRIL